MDLFATCSVDFRRRQRAFAASQRPLAITATTAEGGTTCNTLQLDVQPIVHLWPAWTGHMTTTADRLYLAQGRLLPARPARQTRRRRCCAPRRRDGSWCRSGRSSKPSRRLTSSGSRCALACMQEGDVHLMSHALLERKADSHKATSHMTESRSICTAAGRG